jgi:Tol biopolymer transport system component
MKPRPFIAAALSIVAMLMCLVLRSQPFAIAQGGVTIRVSIASDGTQGNGASVNSAMSADGRYVAFVSSATNLVAGDTNGYDDVFVHDRQTGQTTRVSVHSNGAQGNNRSSLDAMPAISADGRYVAFVSRASNLVDGDTANAYDVFVHDRQTAQTTRVSIHSNGAQGDASASYIAECAISADGRYVAFSSHASTLIGTDTNSDSQCDVNCDRNGAQDIFIHDRQTAQTSRVSISSAGAEADSDSYWPAISADGRYVAFYSRATNLVSGDTNETWDVFVHDRQTGQTTRVSVSSNGTQANAESRGLVISGDGRYVAFESQASNLVSLDYNGALDIFVHDRQTGQTTRASVASDGAEANLGGRYPAISADGRYVAFVSQSNNLVSGDTRNFFDVFRHDQETGETIRVSVASDGTQGSGDSGWSYMRSMPSLSAEGRSVAFHSSAHNLVTNDTNGTEDVFVHEPGAEPTPTPTATTAPTPTPTATPQFRVYLPLILR